MILADGNDVRDIAGVECGSVAEGRSDSARGKPIRLIHLEGSPLIGEKRNFGCERAQGQFIAHWDDDDWSAPERLADQVQRIMESGKAVTGYQSMRFLDAGSQRWWSFEGKPNYAIGTSLLYDREWWIRNKFSPVQIGEDNDFVKRAAAAGQIVSAPADGLMYAVNHPGNTSPKLLERAGWTLLEAA